LCVQARSSHSRANLISCVLNQWLHILELSDADWSTCCSYVMAISGSIGKWLFIVTRMLQHRSWPESVQHKA
jgi:hypothetical protein